MSVDELARLAAQGDTEAFAQLVDLHEKRVYTLALRMTGNPEDACDVTQDAFLAAWRGLPSFRGDAGFSTWLYRLASNAAVDFLRKNRRRQAVLPLEEEADPAPGPQEQAELQDLREAVRWGMGELSREHRKILTLREYQELSYEEIAHRLNLDLGTVKSRISRARGALRKILVRSGNLSGCLPSNPSEKTEGGRI